MKKIILLVEDEPFIALDEKMILEGNGYAVVVADSGEKAIELVAAGLKADLILMDINLGEGIDGTVAAQEIIRRYDVPIVFLSSHTEPDVVEKTEGISSYGYIVKNSGSTVLLASIKMAFKLFEAKKEIKDKNGELTKSNRILESIIKQSPFAIHVLDGDFSNIRVIIENDESRRIMGEKVEGRNGINANNPEDLVCRFFSPDGLQEIPFADMPSPRAFRGEHVINEEYLFRHPDGTEIIVEASASPINDVNGGLLAIVVTFHDITEHVQSKNRVKKLLRDKEIILKEVQHRFKNNMNTLSSLFMLQRDRLENTEAVSILDDASARLRSMKVLYEKLHFVESNSVVSLKAYFAALIEEISGIFPNRDSIKIDTEIEDVVLESNIVVSLGIIVNELITNSMKYAFPGRREGVITLQGFKNEHSITMVYRDNGPGLPDNISLDNSSGLGLRLVKMLAEQIHASVTLEKHRGLEIRIVFSVE